MRPTGATFLEGRRLRLLCFRRLHGPGIVEKNNMAQERLEPCHFGLNSDKFATTESEQSHLDRDFQ